MGQIFFLFNVSACACAIVMFTIALVVMLQSAIVLSLDSVEPILIKLHSSVDNNNVCMLFFYTDVPGNAIT